MVFEGVVGVKMVSEKQHFEKVNVTSVCRRSRNRERMHLRNYG